MARYCMSAGTTLGMTWRICRKRATDGQDRDLLNTSRLLDPGRRRLHERRLVDGIERQTAQAASLQAVHVPRPSDSCAERLIYRPPSSPTARRGPARLDLLYGKGTGTTCPRHGRPYLRGCARATALQGRIPVFGHPVALRYRQRSAQSLETDQSTTGAAAFNGVKQMGPTTRLHLSQSGNRRIINPPSKDRMPYVNDAPARGRPTTAQGRDLPQGSWWPRGRLAERPSARV